MTILRTLGLLLLVATLGFVAWSVWNPADPGLAPDAPGQTVAPAERADAASGTLVESEANAATAVTAEGAQREAVAGAVVATVTGAVVLVGKVTDSQGVPVAGASVRSWPGSRAQRRGGAERGAADAGRVEVVTDDKGGFRLAAGATGATFFLRVLARGHRVLDHSVVRPAEGETDIGTLVLQRGAILSGRVVDAAGAGIAGARVTRGNVRPNMAEAGLAEAGMPDFGDFDFGDFGAMDGPDMDFDAGGDLPGGEWMQEIFAAGSVTDAEGRFELPHVEAGEFSLRARHPDHPSVRRDGLSVGIGGTVADIVIQLAPGATIRGRLVDVPDGVKSLRVLVATQRQTPAAAEGPLGGFGGEMADMMADFGGVGERRADVAADLTFELRGLHPGRTYRLWAVQDARNSMGSVCTLRIEARAPSEGLELRYDPGVTVTFQVTDASGAPVERLWVRDQLRGGGGMGDLMAMAPRAGAARSYPEGRVTLANLRPKKKQTLSLTVEAMRCKAYERKDVVLPLAGILDLGVVRLEPAPVVEVVVRRKGDGVPVEGATVRLATEPKAGADGGNPFERFAAMGMAESGPRSGRTDGDGLCVLNAPAEGPIVVRVTMAEFAPYEGVPFAPPAGGSVRHEAELTRGGSVDVAVVDDAGAPLAEVRVQHAPPRGPRPVRATDRSGHVVFENLAPGEHHFRIAERGGAADFAAAAAAFGGEAGAPTGPGWQMVTVSDGVRADLRLTKDPTATLRGIVRENGKPLAGARVTFLPGPGSGASDDAAENLSSMMAEFGGRDGGRASRTGDDGAYELKNLKAGPHRVRVTGKGRAMPTVVAVTLQPGSNEFDLTLDVTIVRGRVLDPQGQPVAGASVTIVSAAPRTAGADPMAQAMEQVMPGVDVAAFGGNARGVKTGDDGRYELLGVQPGSSVQVRASSKAFAAAASEPFEVAANTVREGVDVRLLAAGKVRVTVAEAPPFSSAQARLLGADGEPVRGVSPVMQVLGSGAATLSGLRAGRWRIDLIQPTAGAPQTRTVEVRAGETVTVAF